MIDFSQVFAVDIQLWHFPVLFFAGLIGESFGALVGGGSIVTMPALLLTGVPLQSAIAVDNAASLGTEAGIVSETIKKIRANKKWVLILAIPLTAGGIVGTWLLLNVPGTIIRYLMIVTVLLVLADAHFNKGRKPRQISRTRYEVVIGFMFLIGIYSNFMTAGEGAFSRIGLMTILGWSFIQSQGIKAAATVPSRIYSLIITAFAGLIIWPYLLTMFCATFLAGRYATEYAKKIPDKYMRSALTVVSLAFVAYLLFFY
ncbi:MAG TPA: sulfite exporter TauE/SafE family protein [Candidatus Saccharimonadales bacterium]|nr:sulfite exporter TauE/SafE family protein [Candidatus Saccharimonadales bacterium]